MRLLLVRHASAVSQAACSSDDDRWLTETGRADARRVGRALADHGLHIDRLLTSPLVRAVQTAELLASAMSFDGAVESHGALAFDRGTTALALAPIEHAPADALYVFVTHEPKIRTLAAHLVGARSFPGFDTAGASLFELENGRLPGKLAWRLDPRTLLASAELE